MLDKKFTREEVNKRVMEILNLSDKEVPRQAIKEKLMNATRMNEPERINK